MNELAFDFDRPVPAGGYRWWYVDAIAPEGDRALSLIAFVGSVFSPYYAAARRRGPADARAHCALNVGLYSRSQRRWTMTERAFRHVSASPRRLAIGPSSLAWDGNTLAFRIDEVGAPLPARVRGSIRLHVDAPPVKPFALDRAGRHRWTPLAPGARIEVALERPAWQWSGTAYVDANDGDEPLEDGFARWQWSRATLRDRRTVVFYDVEPRAGDATALSLCLDGRGGVDPVERPPAARAAPTFWRVPRSPRSETGSASLRATLEDGPFYARSLFDATVAGEPVTMMHESLSLDRFRRRWVQALLPFRMPRVR